MTTRTQEVQIRVHLKEIIWRIKYLFVKEFESASFFVDTKSKAYSADPSFCGFNKCAYEMFVGFKKVNSYYCTYTEFVVEPFLYRSVHFRNCIELYLLPYVLFIEYI